MAKYLIILTVVLFCIEIQAINDNFFEATLGCLQFNAKDGHMADYPYFSTSVFKNIHITNKNVTKMRLGVLGRNDAHIRLAPVRYPFDGTVMNEVALSIADNTRTEIRRYLRQDCRTRSNNAVLHKLSSVGLMSDLSPMMFTMEIDAHGNVKLIQDGDVNPFMESQDSNLSANYLGFFNWDVPVVFFYDCPLEVERRDCRYRNCE